MIFFYLNSFFLFNSFILISLTLLMSSLIPFPLTIFFYIEFLLQPYYLILFFGCILIIYFGVL